MHDAGGPGIVEFELAWDRAGADEILADWDEEGTDAARDSLRVDYAFLLAYGAFFTLAAMATRDLARRRGWARMAAAGGAAISAAVAAPVFDAVENVFLLVSLEGEGGGLAPFLGSLFASLKFAALVVCAAYLLAGLVLRFRSTGEGRLDA